MIKYKKEIKLPDPGKVLKLAAEIIELPDGLYTIYASDQKPQRTLRQNRYLRAIDSMIAGFTGDNPNDVHEYLIELHSEPVMMGIKGGASGMPVEITRKMRTSEFDTRQMTNYIERVRQWSNDFLGFYIPAPDDVPDEVYIQYDLKR